VEGESIYGKLHQPKFHWLVFSETENESERLRTEVEKQYADLVDFTALPLSPEVGRAFGTDKAFNLLLRPDNYIGFISEGSSLSGVSAYLSEVIRCS
jgi:hypothetical protein